MVRTSLPTRKKRRQGGEDDDGHLERRESVESPPRSRSLVRISYLLPKRALHRVILFCYAPIFGLSDLRLKRHPLLSSQFTYTAPSPLLARRGVRGCTR